MGAGRLLLTTLPSAPRTIKAESVDRTMLANLGFALHAGMDSGKPLLRTGILVRALACGYLPAEAEGSAEKLWQDNAFRADTTMDGRE